MTPRRRGALDAEAIVNRYLAGTSIADIAVELRCTTTTVRRIVRQHEAAAALTLVPDEDRDSVASRRRGETRLVQSYLRGLRAMSVRPTRVARERIRRELDVLARELELASGGRRRELLRRRRELGARLPGQVTPEQLARWEASFVEIAAHYGAEHGIDYRRWRRLGVPARVLHSAGLWLASSR